MDNGKKNGKSKNAFNCPARFDKGSACDCSYCTEHQAIYDKIDPKKAKWVTISPPDHGMDPDDFFKDWNEFFHSQLRYFGKNILGVCELKNLRQHFHIVYETTDNKKEFLMWSKIKKQCQTAILHGYPKGGIHYLFKDIQDSFDLLNVHPIITEASIWQTHKIYQREKKLKLIEHDVFVNKIDKYSLPKP